MFDWILLDNYRQKLLFIGALIAFFAAIWHWLCIFGGPSWFEFARAPQIIVQSAQQGTWLAPLGAIVVGGVMFACTLFAFASLGIIAQLPLCKTALITISLLCLVRGLMIVPVWLFELGVVDVFSVVASVVWFFVGVCYFCGAYESFQQKNEIGECKLN